MRLFFMSMTIIGSQYTKNPTKGIGIAFAIFQWLFGVSYALAWSGLLVAYTVEILPYKLCAKRLMITNFWVQVALTIDTYVNPIPHRRRVEELPVEAVCLLHRLDRFRARVCILLVHRDSVRLLSQ
jgi:hypothetical protein